MRRKAMFCLAGLSVAAAVVLIMVTRSADGAFVRITGTFVRVTQVRPTTEKGAKDDAGIPKDVLRIVKNKFLSKYKAYKMEGNDGRTASMGESETYTLTNGETIVVTIASYSPTKDIVDVQIQRGDDIKLVSIRSPGHLAYVYESAGDEKPLIVVLTIQLLKVQR